jgi:hypothetical protein
MPKGAEEALSSHPPISRLRRVTAPSLGEILYRRKIFGNSKVLRRVNPYEVEN